MDAAGQVLQHDRRAQDVLLSPDGILLGSRLSDLIIESPATVPSLNSLLEAAAAGREATAMLTFRTGQGEPLAATVTVQPMHAHGTTTSLAILRIPPPSGERHFAPAAMRHALLDEPLRRIGATLDLDQVARGLVHLVVPHFCHNAGLLMLENVLSADEAPSPTADGTHLLRRLATAFTDDDGAREAAFPSGEVMPSLAGTPYAQCLDTGKPVLISSLSKPVAASLTDSGANRSARGLMASASMLVLPLTAEGITLGVLVCGRHPESRTFDASDVEIGEEFAARAAVFLDHARRYDRQRATALTLQRSMLPAGLSAPSSVEVQHRYLPGSHLIEVGGDWYESIRLPGARVVLVIGDVAGHGVQAAVTMGRLRAAIQMLAMLELSPPEALQHLNDLMRVMGDREPHFATCAYAIYNAVDGTMEVASAGHLPPLLAGPRGAEFLDITPAPPLGVGEGLITSHVVDVEDGSVLVLYTDGLVESRGRDIDGGLARLREVFASSYLSGSLDGLATTSLASVYADRHRDDIAVLIARLHRISEDNRACWTLPSLASSVGKARAMMAETLAKWQLDPLLDVTKLLVSELVTNAIQHAGGGPVTLRLIREGAVVCEVADSSPMLPHARPASNDDEYGRGLRIVSQLSHRWGARRTPAGKVVWCELQAPAPEHNGTPVAGPGR